MSYRNTQLVQQVSTSFNSIRNIINEEEEQEEWFQFWETPDDFVYNKTTTNQNNNKKKKTIQSKHRKGRGREKEVSTNRDRYALPCLESAEPQCESLLDDSKIVRCLPSPWMSDTSVN